VASDRSSNASSINHGSDCGPSTENRGRRDLPSQRDGPPRQARESKQVSRQYHNWGSNSVVSEYTGSETGRTGITVPHEVTIHPQELQISDHKVKRTVHPDEVVLFVKKDIATQLCIVATQIQHDHCLTLVHLHQNIPWKDFYDSFYLGQELK